MARFRFQLETVLRHRRNIEREKQRAVAELETQRVRLENDIRECQQGLERERGELTGRLTEADLHGVRWQAAAAMRLIVAAQRAALELAGVMKRLGVARADLLEAAKRRKAVELLRERRFDEWKLDQNRRELAAVDELAVMAAGRASGRKDEA
jgi:flagellar FliJ protein